MAIHPTSVELIRHRHLRFMLLFTTCHGRRPILIELFPFGQMRRCHRKRTSCMTLCLRTGLPVWPCVSEQDFLYGLVSLNRTSCMALCLWTGLPVWPCVSEQDFLYDRVSYRCLWRARRPACAAPSRTSWRPVGSRWRCWAERRAGRAGTKPRTERRSRTGWLEERRGSQAGVTEVIGPQQKHSRAKVKTAPEKSNVAPDVTREATHDS